MAQLSGNHIHAAAGGKDALNGAKSETVTASGERSEPGQGTTVLINGKASIEPIKEPEFFSALLRIWLGHAPADAQLKDALLGKAPAPRDPFNN